jgi:hypothetical protein
MNHAYFLRNVIVTSLLHDRIIRTPKRIMLRYLKSWFFIDFISCTLDSCRKFLRLVVITRCIVILAAGFPLELFAGGNKSLKVVRDANRAYVPRASLMLHTCCRFRF